MAARRLWLALGPLVVLSCARANSPGTTTSASPRTHTTVKAADCRFSIADSSPLMGESEVDDPPRIQSPGPQRYPSEARLHGISGQVAVTYVVGRDGLVIRPSVRIVDATAQVFVPATEEMLYSSRFSPGVHLGAPVATCVKQVVKFSIQ